jgi:hypothetical protein
LPRGLGDVVRKMMAKSAEKRYQTPAEVAAALLPFTGGNRPILTQPAELAGTLLPDDIPGLSAGLSAGPTVAPGEALHHTSAGTDSQDALTATAPALPRQGSTERLSREPDGLQATQMPGAGFPGGEPTKLLRGNATGLQATQLLQQSATQAGQTEPLIQPRGRGALIAAVVLVGIGAAGAVIYLATRPAPARLEADAGNSSVATAPPQATISAAGNPAPLPGEGTPPTAKTKKDDTVPMPPMPVPVEAPPAGPPAKALARVLMGDRSDLAMARTRGPAVRTGGRSLSWSRRRELYALSPHKGLRAAFSADGSRAVYSTPTEAILVYGLREIQPGSTTSLPELTGNLTDGVSHVNAVGLSPDGNRVLLATVGRSEKPLDGNPVTTRFNMLVSWELSGATELIYGPRIDLAAGFGCLAFSPDGKEVLIGGAIPQIYRWRPGSKDLRTGRRYFKHGAGDVVDALAYSADGRLAASGGMDKLVCVFDTTKADSSPQTMLSGLHTRALSVAISPGGKHVLAGGREGKACLWEVGDEPAATITKPLNVFEWHNRESDVKVMAFAPSGKFFVTGSTDGTVCLGEVGKDKPVWTEAPRGAGSILGLMVSPDGRQVIVADEVGLGEYSLVQDVTAVAKAGVAAADAEVAPAESKGH